jgi:hypothetical protein
MMGAGQRRIIMRKHTWKLPACLLLCAVVTGAARAQAPAPETTAAARELVVTMRSADQFKALLPIIMKNLKPAIVQGRPEIERDFDATWPSLMEGLNARVNEIVDEITAIYARNFTADELREITAFYRGPAGQKFLEKQPAVAQESMQIGQKFGAAVAADVTRRMTEELRKRGHGDSRQQ